MMHPRLARYEELDSLRVTYKLMVPHEFFVTTHWPTFWLWWWLTKLLWSDGHYSR